MKIRAYGFMPDSNEDEKRKRETELFIKSFNTIYDNADRIINTPEYFFCEFGTAYLSLAYLGGGEIPLGVLLLLWKEGKLREKCPCCGGDVYVFGAGGSPLSGSNSWRGYCPVCAKKQIGRSKYFHDIWYPIYSKMKEYPNEEIVEKGKSPVFSWSKGLTGEYIPDRIIKPKIIGISLEKLIEVLKAE